jgi:hypothetical protein
MTGLVRNIFLLACAMAAMLWGDRVQANSSNAPPAAMRLAQRTCYFGVCEGDQPVAPRTAPALPPPTQSTVQYSYPINLDPNGDNWLALRSEPDGHRGVRLMKIGPETLFTVIGQSGNWVHIRLRSGQIGWAYKSYIGCCRSGPP